MHFFRDLDDEGLRALHPEVAPRIASVGRRQIIHTMLHGLRGIGKIALAHLLVASNAGVTLASVAAKQQRTTFVHKDKTYHAEKSQHHFEVDVALIGNGSDDQMAIVHLMNELSKTKNVLRNTYKVLVVRNAELLAKPVQHILRRLVETVYETLRICFVCNNINCIDQTIRSRLLTIVVRPPSAERAHRYVAQLIDAHTHAAAEDAAAAAAEDAAASDVVEEKTDADEANDPTDDLTLDAFAKTYAENGCDLVGTYYQCLLGAFGTQPPPRRMVEQTWCTVNNKLTMMRIQEVRRLLKNLDTSGCVDFNQLVYQLLLRATKKQKSFRNVDIVTYYMHHMYYQYRIHKEYKRESVLCALIVMCGANNDAHLKTIRQNMADWA
jgi:DNA polymerase III delta prime subunit